MRSRYRYLDPGQCSKIREWWRALQPASEDEKKVAYAFREFGRGDRARIRRCSTIEELEQESAPNHLAACLVKSDQTQKPWLQLWFQEHYESLFLLAGVLAHVKEDAQDGQSLALRVGNAKGAADQPALMSELRFKRLLQAQEMEDFFRQMRRAVQLAGGVADVTVLAEDLVAWSLERDKKASEAGLRQFGPRESLKFRWARDYYLTAKEQLSSESDNASKV